MKGLAKEPLGRQTDPAAKENGLIKKVMTTNNGEGYGGFGNWNQTCRRQRHHIAR